MTTPKIIYLCADADDEYGDKMTWCEDAAGEAVNVKYLQADIVKAKLEKLRAEFENESAADDGQGNRASAFTVAEKTLSVTIAALGLVGEEGE